MSLDDTLTARELITPLAEWGRVQREFLSPGTGDCGKQVAVNNGVDCRKEMC